MAKRFIDTAVFRKPSIRAMKAPYKVLFIYLLCECDHAGVWDVELDVATMRLGIEIDHEKAVEELRGAVIPIGGGSKWYLVDFVEFQYGELNPANRVHESVLSRLQTLAIDHKKKGLTSPLQGAKDMDKDKDTVLKEKERAKETPSAKWPSWAGERTLSTWEEFKTYRMKEHKARYKSIDTEQRAVDILAKYFSDGPTCVAALEHSIGKGWQFPVDPTEYKYPAAEGKQATWNARA